MISSPGLKQPLKHISILLYPQMNMDGDPDAQGIFI
jgi:hypothetical protein